MNNCTYSPSRIVVQCDPLTSSSRNDNLRILIPQCLPANSPFTFPYPGEYENHFEQCLSEIAENRKLLNSDKDKRTPEIIRAYDYDLVTYDEVTTEDGYILTVFRIPGGPKSPPAFGKPAVLLHHGLLTASDNWVLQYGDRNLAFKLADAGYDVWLANARGTDFSQRHTQHSVPNGAYWQFGLLLYILHNNSFHEIAIYDLPAIIDVMLNETGNNDIFYVGHSMGATVYAIALSEIPELNKKIRAGFMLAPAIHLGHAYNPLRKLTTIVGTPIQDIVYYFLKGHFNGGTNKFLELLGLSPGDVCTPTAFRCKVCENLVFFMFGFNAPQTNYTNLPNVLSKIRNTASLRTVIHFAQNLLSCEFRKYDYGLAGNWQAYGSFHPPSYDLHGVTAPTYIFYGESDNFIPITVRDINTFLI
ncbi:Lipase 3 [Orchesella cincta]|uniref:Lipase n=1 Tax=Orchesella cincta TaxID=48709 RepID=A0A1D2N7D9_ORCCI|nr:Lipase 3 [Orchesella cincta]